MSGYARFWWTLIVNECHAAMIIADAGCLSDLATRLAKLADRVDALEKFLTSLRARYEAVTGRDMHVAAISTANVGDFAHRAEVERA